MRADIRRLFVWMSVFFMAMAYLESAVVVYLRALYYPEGFEFPLVGMDRSMVYTEVFREAATLIMLFATAALVTRSALERFAWFCFGFGIWDIFYYVWLKALLDWPSSLASRDLLFLIPVPWVGPVWAPCAISLGLIALAVVILRSRSRKDHDHVDRISWMLLITGALLFFISFTVDPLVASFVVDGLVDTETMALSRSTALANGRDYIPEDYPWAWFVVGLVSAFMGILRIHRRS